MNTVVEKNHTLEGMTLAVTNMDAMVKFYQEVFGVSFAAIEMFGATLYCGEWGNLKLLFCPAHVAGNTATQNRHQLELIVNDLDVFIQNVKEHGGKLLGDISLQGDIKSIGIYDPDNNSLVLKQHAR